MFKVNIIESELGWGRKVDSVKEFPTEKLALAFIKEYNKDNPEHCPDWYMQAELVPGGTEDFSGRLLMNVMSMVKGREGHKSRKNLYKDLLSEFPELSNYV